MRIDKMRIDKSILVVACLVALAASAAAQQRGPEPAAGDTGASAAETDPAQEFAFGLDALERRDLNAAATHFQRVVASDPMSFEAHNNLAVIYSEQGKDELALGEVRRALELQPEYYRGRKNMAELYARLTSRAFVDAAALAPPEERNALMSRAQRLDRANGVSDEEPRLEANGVAKGDADAHEEAAASSFSPGRVAPVPTRYLLSLGEPGQAAFEIRPDSLSFYKQSGSEVRLVASYPIQVQGTLPGRRALYLASKNGTGIALAPVDGASPELHLGATAGAATHQIVIQSEHLDAVSNALDPALTPVVIIPEMEINDPEKVRREVAAAFERWHESWVSKDVDGYVSSYVSSYRADKGSHAAWVKGRERIFGQSGDLQIDHSPPVVLQIDHAVVTLTRQHYRSALLQSRGVKLLTWMPAEAGWRISEERMLMEQPVSGQ